MSDSARLAGRLPLSAADATGYPSPSHPGLAYCPNLKARAATMKRWLIGITILVAMGVGSVGWCLRGDLKARYYAHKLFSVSDAETTAWVEQAAAWGDAVPDRLLDCLTSADAIVCSRTGAALVQLKAPATIGAIGRTVRPSQSTGAAGCPRLRGRLPSDHSAGTPKRRPQGTPPRRRTRDAKRIGAIGYARSVADRPGRGSAPGRNSRGRPVAESRRGR